VPDSGDACPTQAAATANGCPSSAPTPAPSSSSAICDVEGPLPDPDCTPGRVFKTVTVKQVCRPGYSKRVRKVAEATKDRISHP